MKRVLVHEGSSGSVIEAAMTVLKMPRRRADVAGNSAEDGRGVGGSFLA
jgi:hypothetical protein